MSGNVAYTVMPGPQDGKVPYHTALMLQGFVVMLCHTQLQEITCTQCPY